MPAGSGTGAGRQTPLTPPANQALPLPPGTLPPPGGTAGSASGSSGWAVASLILGIISFACLPVLGAILALLCGAVGKHDIKKSGRRLGGSGMATAGMVLGAVNILIFAACVAVFVPLALLRIGKLETVTRTIGAQGAQSVRADFDLREGRLTVKGGADALFEGRFSFNVRTWGPDIDYRVDGTRGEITVRQGGRRWIPVHWFIRNDWDIALNGGLPLELKARLEDGDGRFYLSGLCLLVLEVEANRGDIAADLSGDMPYLQRVVLEQGSGDASLNLTGKYPTALQLDVETRGGDVSVDLRGEWHGSLAADIATGGGDVVLRLPAGVGVRIRVGTQAGEVIASGMKRGEDGSGRTAYTNEDYGLSPITLSVNVESGGGDITVLP